jgi:hypothetical protein
MPGRNLYKLVHGPSAITCFSFKNWFNDMNYSIKMNFIKIILHWCHKGLIFRLLNRCIRGTVSFCARKLASQSLLSSSAGCTTSLFTIKPCGAIPLIVFCTRVHDFAPAALTLFIGQIVRDGFCLVRSFWKRIRIMCWILLLI